MKPEEAFEAWKRARATSRVPEGFSERVMAEVRADPARPETVPVLLAVLGRSRRARIAVVLLAAFACAARITGTLAILFTT